MVRAVKTVVPVSSSSSISTNGGGVNNFTKISRLNDALQAINPRYQPIGFSITSMESCSPSVLQDAISAAETGVFTLLSVIGEISRFYMSCVHLKKSKKKSGLFFGFFSRLFSGFFWGFFFPFLLH